MSEHLNSPKRMAELYTAIAEGKELEAFINHKWRQAAICSTAYAVIERNREYRIKITYESALREAMEAADRIVGSLAERYTMLFDAGIEFNKNRPDNNT